MEHDSFDARAHFIGPPKGFTPDGEVLHRVVSNASATIDLRSFIRPYRHVSKHALVDGTLRKIRIIADPGERVRYSYNQLADFGGRVVIELAIVWRGPMPPAAIVRPHGFLLVEDGGTREEPESWPQSIDRKGTKPQTLDASSLWSAFNTALDRGFSAGDLELAFGDAGPMAVVRDAARSTILAHVDGVAPSARMAYLTAAAKHLPGFDPAAAGAFVADAFEDSLAATLSSSNITKTLDIVRKLTG